ncbi:Sodium:solute symporter family [Popillia japonica]|uniref:Sodium:solute symporter family n=1 Tax=Popillia japonica TaxID=7064 RepID=A0AAW1JXS6_POPJA
MEYAKAGERLHIDVDINPLKRQTLWAAILGISCTWIANIGVGQGYVQKFLSLPSMKACKQYGFLRKCFEITTKLSNFRTTIIMAIGMLVAKSYVVLTGLMMYAKYHDCDPIITKRVQKTDQVIPFFVLDVARNIPGLPGLFIAGVFCASLSTLSALLNCISGVIYEDFLKTFLPKDLSQQSVSNILKIIVLVSGIISTTLVVLVEHLRSIFPLGKGILRGFTKPVSVDGCPFPLNETLISTPIPVPEDQLPFFLYRISYYYYTLIGACVTTIVGLIVSYLTRKKDDPPVHKDLITPLMHFLLPQEEAVITEKVYYRVEKALEALHIETEVCEN